MLVSGDPPSKIEANAPPAGAITTGAATVFSAPAAGFESYIFRDWKARRHGPGIGPKPNDPSEGGFDSYAFRDMMKDHDTFDEPVSPPWSSTDEIEAAVRDLRSRACARSTC